MLKNRLTLIHITSHGSDVCLLVNGKIIITADPQNNEPVSVVENTAINLASSLDCELQIIKVPGTSDWTWDDVVKDVTAGYAAFIQEPYSLVELDIALTQSAFITISGTMLRVVSYDPAAQILEYSQVNSEHKLSISLNDLFEQVNNVQLYNLCKLPPLLVLNNSFEDPSKVVLSGSAILTFKVVHRLEASLSDIFRDAKYDITHDTIEHYKPKSFKASDPKAECGIGLIDIEVFYKSGLSINALDTLLETMQTSICHDDVSSANFIGVLTD